MSSSFNTCVIDVGSPKLGNIGWCLKYAADREEQSGDCLNSLVDLIVDIAEDGPIILGLDAPLSVPIRDELILTCGLNTLITFGMNKILAKVREVFFFLRHL